MSGEPIEELLIKISADMSGLVASMTKTGQVVDQLAGHMGESAGKHIAHGFFTAELAVHAFEKALEFLKEHTIDLVKESYEHIEAQTRLADRLGVTTEAFGGLALQAEHNGSSMEAMAQAMTIMERNLASASDKGNEAGFALKALKVDVKELLALSPDEQMAKIGGALDKVGNAADRTQIAMALFGRGGAQMINVLHGGEDEMLKVREEAERIGVALNRIDADKVIKANLQFKTMHAILEGIGNRLAIASAPFLEAIVKHLNDAAIESHGFETQIKSALQGAATGIAYVSDALIGFQIMWDGIRLAVAVLGDVFYQVMNALVQEGVTATKALTDVFAAFIKGTADSFTWLMDKLADGLSYIDEDAANSLRAFSTSVGDAVKKTTDDVKASIDDVVGGLGEASQGMADEATQTVVDAKADLDAAIDQPIPHDAIIEWGQAIVDEADKAGAEVAAKINAATGGVGREQGPEEPNSSGGAKDRQQHLQELKEALQQETDVEIQMHEERMSLLNQMDAQHEIEHEEFNSLAEQEEQRHQLVLYNLQKKNSDKIRTAEQARDKDKIAGMKSMLGDLSTLMNSHSKKAFEIGKVAAIANATISGIEAAVHAWKWGMNTGGPYAAAAFTAASIAATAVQISQIASQSFGGGGGGASSFSGGVPAINTAPQAGAGQNGGASGKFVNITLQGSGKYDRKEIEDMISGINDAVGDGVTLRTR